VHTTAVVGRGQLKCDDTRAETRFRLSAKRPSQFKSAWASVQSTTNSRGVRISGSNVGYTMFRGSVKGTGYPLHSPVSLSLHLPFVTVSHHIATGLYVFVSKMTGSKVSTVTLLATFVNCVSLFNIPPCNYTISNIKWLIVFGILLRPSSDHASYRNKGKP